MSARVILSIIIIVLGATSAILPDRTNSSIELNERQLLQEILMDKNYVTADELADILINGDPSVRIIDVRPASEFKEGIPRAINIPFDSIYSENWLPFFDQFAMKNVIYAADEKTAVEVWMLMKQKGYLNNYLLKGGLEGWKSTILDPKLPSSTEPQEAFDTYRKRLAAKQYFTGAKELPKVQIQPIAPIQRREKKKVQGGCS